MPGDQVGIVFFILAAVIVAAALMVVTLRNIFHCAIALIVCLFCVAGIFILLGAEFLAAAQVLIYVGAVAILMIFAIMLTSNLATKKISQTNENALIAGVVCVVFFGNALLLIWQTYNDVWVRLVSGNPLPSDNVLTLGKYLMTQFVLPFEVVSVLLLAALIGAIALARKERS